MRTAEKREKRKAKMSAEFEDFESFEDLEKWRAEEQARSSQTILTLKDGDVVTFRFLREFIPMFRFLEHSYFDEKNKSNGFHAVCASMMKQQCYYCKLAAERDEYTMKAHMSLVYPTIITDWQNPRNKDGEAFRKSQVGERKLFIIKLHKKQTMDTTLKNYYDKAKTILSGEWTYTRHGEKKMATYSLSGYRTEDTRFPLMSREEVHDLLFTVLPPKTGGIRLVEPESPSDDLDDHPF